SKQGALSLIGNPAFQKAYAPLLLEIEFFQFDDISSLDIITCQTAAFMVEVIRGEAGVRVPSTEFMRALRRKCDETGAILVFDDRQTGFGRTRKMFAFEHFGIVPDVLMLAKGIGGAMPLGAFVARKEVMDVIKDNPMLGHITTDRKSTRLNSSHVKISYAVFCLKKKKKQT